MKNRIGWRLADLILTAAVLLPAQTPTEFEVASVRQNKLDDRIVTVSLGPGGRFTARGYTLVLLIQRAYGVMDWNVSGGPSWIRSDRFDVNAKANLEGNLTEKQLRPMLQKLLADRFKLTLHRSSQEMAGHALVVDRRGPKVKAAADREEHPDTFRWSATGLSGQGIPMADLARYVGGKLGLVAVDQTGLTGLYDFKVDWRVEPDPFAVGEDPREAMRLAVNTALQEQLGLKLVAKKVPVPMLVIENAEKATSLEN